MEPVRTYPDELDVLVDKDRGLTYFSMRRIVVDEVFSEWLAPQGGFSVHRNVIVGIKDDWAKGSTPSRPFFDAPYDYVHDDYDIDEEVWLKVGWITTLNPKNDQDREDAELELRRRSLHVNDEPPF
jgi:hypothetical protein